MMKIALLAGALLSVMTSHVTATDTGRADDRCSVSDLRGVYSFVAAGTMGGNPFGSAGQTTYDGRGGAAGVIQISVNGNALPRLDWHGPYAVDPVTCTATKTANIDGVGSVDFFITFGDGFKELR